MKQRFWYRRVQRSGGASQPECEKGGEDRAVVARSSLTSFCISWRGPRPLPLVLVGLGTGKSDVRRDERKIDRKEDDRRNEEGLIRKFERLRKR